MKELADYLKSERLERGLTLDTVARGSGLSLSVLESLESAEWQRFGASILVRNYIRAYCAALGIESAPLLEKYAADINSCDRQQEYIDRFGKCGRAFKACGRIRPFSLLLMGIALLGVVAGAIWVSEKRARMSETPPLADSMYSQQELPPDLPARSSQVAAPEVRRELSPAVDQPVGDNRHVSAPKGNRDAESQVPAKTATGPVVAAPQVTSNSTEVHAEDKLLSPPQDPRKNVFAVEADEKTWIQVRLDDKTTQSAMMYPGEKREWLAADNMQIVVGNSGGVRMKWNGQPINASGKSGRVLRFRLPDPQYAGEQ